MNIRPANMAGAEFQRAINTYIVSDSAPTDEELTLMPHWSERVKPMSAIGLSASHYCVAATAKTNRDIDPDSMEIDAEVPSRRLPLAIS